jgi:cbb3-type cytochrome oxidase subunit 3
MAYDAPNVSPKLDLSIEGMRSQAFGHGVFAFLLIGIAVFAVIVSVFWATRKGSRDAKLGEKLMFGAIVAGMVVAVAFGALQMVGGFLF